MSAIEISLSRYDGPAMINGVEFARVRIGEHAEGGDGWVVRSWDGAAKAARSEVPAVNSDWALLPGPVEVRVPEVGTGRAYIQSVTLDGSLWEIELTGEGPSPMA
ncbi:hypothetical protein ABZ883_14860 [Streptomyces sp. NPDC046977]|uniref:hypothetical protein n=1 Tax=Streptomyces sp. NPDC046977 TaxID=3154703 RepID=UPI0033C58363